MSNVIANEVKQEETKDTQPQDQPGQPQADLSTPPPPPANLKEEVERYIAALAQAVALQQNELNELKKLVQSQPQKTQDAQHDEVDIDKLFYESPSKAIKKVLEDFETKIKAEVTQTYQTDQGAKQFWNEFFSENKDLENAKELVELTLRKNWNRFAALSIQDAKRLLADEAREEIKRLTQRLAPKPKETPHVESGGLVWRERIGSQPTASSVKSLGDIIRERKMKRYANE